MNGYNKQPLEKELLSQAYDELDQLLEGISDIDKYERIKTLLINISKELYGQI